MKVEDQIRSGSTFAHRAMRAPLLSAFALSLTLSASVLSLAAPVGAVAASPIDMWWPTNGAHMQGTQPFKGMISGLDPSQYQMYWQVDGGSLVPMQDNSQGYPHKEASVDLSGWTWNGQGPYEVTFVAKQNGQVIGEQQETIYNDGAQATVQAPSNSNSNSTQASNSNPTPAPVTSLSAATVSVQSSNYAIDPWWPTANATLTGVQPFKAMIPGLDVSQYQMYWQVDGGSLVPMGNSYTDYQHKEVNVDVSGWHWQQSGTYRITFVAKDGSGNQIASLSIPVSVNASTQNAATPATNPTPSQSGDTTIKSAMMPSRSGDPLSGLSLYVDPNSDAARQEASWQGNNSSGAAAMQTLASQPTAMWFGDWNSNIQSDVHNAVAQASSQGSVPVLVAYDIPERDCGGYSSGGASSASAYNSWINGFAQGIGNSKAVVILEPDALAEMSCLSSGDQSQRTQLLSSAVSTLKRNGNTAVYIDAGHSGWVDANTMASRLQQSGISQADGFALNVSNFNKTGDEENYGSQVSQALGGKHFVIDTSRNGNGSNGQWCNPSGAAIGQKPTTNTGNNIIDAFLWVKTPGESDGSCNGGPSAGVWWPDYAVSLVQNAH